MDCQCPYFIFCSKTLLINMFRSMQRLLKIQFADVSGLGKNEGQSVFLPNFSSQLQIVLKSLLDQCFLFHTFSTRLPITVFLLGHPTNTIAQQLCKNYYSHRYCSQSFSPEIARSKGINISLFYNIWFTTLQTTCCKIDFSTSKQTFQLQNNQFTKSHLHFFKFPDRCQGHSHRLTLHNYRQQHGGKRGKHEVAQ